MMGTREVWRASSNGWSRRGRADRTIDARTLYLTRDPALAGPTSREADLTLDSGVKNIPAGAVYKNVLLSGTIASIGAGASVENVIIDVPATTDDAQGHGIKQWSSGVSNVKIKDVLVRCRPENQSYHIGSAVHGSGWSALGLRVEGMTDGFTMAGVSQRGEAEIIGFWIDPLVKYAYDGYPDRQGSHADGSHPDGGALEGNLKKAWILNGHVKLGDQTTSGFIITQNAGGTTEDLLISDTEFELVSGASIGSFINVAKSGMDATGFRIQRNIFPTGSSPARIYMRPEYLTLTKASGGLVPTGPLANRYVGRAAGDPIVPVYNGTSNLTDY